MRVFVCCAHVGTCDYRQSIISRQSSEHIQYGPTMIFLRPFPIIPINIYVEIYLYAHNDALNWLRKPYNAQTVQHTANIIFLLAALKLLRFLLLSCSFTSQSNAIWWWLCGLCYYSRASYFAWIIWKILIYFSSNSFTCTPPLLHLLIC